MTLPTNIDASYPDRSPGDKAHQQHHDVIHALNNAFHNAPDGTLFVKENGQISTIGTDAYATPGYVDSATYGTVRTSIFEGSVVLEGDAVYWIRESDNHVLVTGPGEPQPAGTIAAWYDKREGQVIPYDGLLGEYSLRDEIMAEVEALLGVADDDSEPVTPGGDLAEKLIAWAAGVEFGTAAFQPTSGMVHVGEWLVGYSGVWPDGSGGVFEATSVSAFGVDAFTVTHDSSSQQVTQGLRTRDIHGRVTAQPALIVEGA